MCRFKVEPLVSDGRYFCHLRMYKLTPEIIGPVQHQAARTEQNLTFWIYSWKLYHNAQNILGYLHFFSVYSVTGIVDSAQQRRYIAKLGN